MKVAVVGRTPWLLDGAREILSRGHKIQLVWTCGKDDYFGTSPADFEDFARKCDATYVHDIGINQPGNITRLRDASCDIAISVNWLTMLSAEVLNSFPLGILNAHAGDLPRFRGNACPNWGILNNEPNITLCIHRMTPELDAGPVLLRDNFPLNANTYIGDVYDWLGERIPQLFAKALDGLTDGTLLAIDQPNESEVSLRCYPRRPEDGRIDWSWAEEQVLRLVRASSRPFSGAFTTLEGEQRVTIWRAEETNHPGDYLAVPGQVCFDVDGDPVIACGNGVVRLTEVSLEGLSDSASSKATILSSLRNRLI